MKNGFIKLSLLFTGLLTLVGLAGFLYSARNTEAKPEEKIDICHCEPTGCQTLNVSEKALKGHFDAQGNPLHAGDHLGACKKDLCNNIDLVQETVPDNYYADKGACYPKTPSCLDRTAINYDSHFDKNKEYEDKSTCKYHDKKAIEVVQSCDGSVTVTIHGGDTRRTWKVEDVEAWIDYDETHVFIATSLDVVIYWKHDGEWQVADESYVTRTKAENCVTPTPPETHENVINGNVGAPVCNAPDVVNAPTYTPENVKRIDHDTVDISWTNNDGHSAKYGIYYGHTENNLPYYVEVQGHDTNSVEVNGMVGMVWYKVCAISDCGQQVCGKVVDP